ncbi:MAG: anhydro-N-acetylmuramic acid kinase [Saprospiraceae bacterium]|nr:anhydro-N-acetylmuramic acid kinase [Saprospiraceae bacterium]
MTDHIVTGLMSGSSLDGVDMATLRISHSPDPGIPPSWAFLAMETMDYPQEWQKRLRELPGGSALDLARAHAGLGELYADMLLRFHQRHLVTPDVVALHGHTVFHHPEEHPGFSTQIGDGSLITVQTGIPTVCDFRNGDIALGGQGAPMAPLADLFLFPGYKAYLNLGGIANLTLFQDDIWTGWDVWACNQLLNALAGLEGLTMDRDGQLARNGAIIPALVQQALQDPWLKTSPPKSLDNTQVQLSIVAPFLTATGTVADRMASAVEAIRTSIAHALPPGEENNPGRILVTGGGAQNTWLMKRLMDGLQKVHWQVVLPNKEIIEYKESALIALAGLWRWLGRPNFIPTVTGAEAAACGGAVYLPGNSYLRP